MKKSILILSFLFLLLSCKDEKIEEKQQIEFKQEKFKNEIAIASNKDSTNVIVNIPIAIGKSITADSINKKMFLMVKEIVSFDEKPLKTNDYKDLLASFTNSYKKFVTDFLFFGLARLHNYLPRLFHL